MARPLSEAKHDAILKAATRAIAVDGLGAPTARIAKEAGVAEGSIFTYFPTKDALFNQLYQSIKLSIATAMMRDYPQDADAKARAHHVWLNYVGWGVLHEDERKALSQLSVSSRLTPEVLKTSMEPLNEVHRLLTKCSNPELQPSVEFSAALMAVMAEKTMEFMTAKPTEADAYAEAGFGSFWRAIAGNG